MKREEILIEVEELLTKLADPRLRIYDASIQFYMDGKGPEGRPTAFDGYLQGHIPGAAFFDHELFSDPTSKYEYMMLYEPELCKRIGRIGIAEDSEVVFYATELLPCATRAWWILRYAGHNNVRILNGGLAAWKQAGGGIETKARQYQATNFECHPRPNMFVSKEEVMAAIGDDRVRTVNTLMRDNHEEAHIVGSTCLPCVDLMQGWDTLLPTDEIAPKLEDESQHERIITYCGGGIAATVNAVAHLFAGNENVAVYDGSLYEWIGEGLPTANGREAR
jgi:thiosulfate/3-mercaptopyruvate sulfurtransferase